MIKIARKHCENVSGAIPSHLGPVFNFKCSGGFGPGKVIKIQLKQFLAILTRNDKNCTLNRVGIFRVQNQVIRAQFSILPAMMVFRLGKVVKIRPKHFSFVLTGNDKNYTLNRVGMFRVRNRVILARFSALLAPVVIRPGKVGNIRSKHFLAVLTENYKNCTLKSVGPAQVVYSAAKVVKIRLIQF